MGILSTGISQVKRGSRLGAMLLQTKMNDHCRIAPSDLNEDQRLNAMMKPGLTRIRRDDMVSVMNAIEFTTELSGEPVLTIPNEIAAQLPKAGKARVIVLTTELTDDAEWQAAAYEQFLRDDSSDDAEYDSLV